MDEKITIMFPNEGEYDIPLNMLIEWKIESCETIGDTNFCKTTTNGYFSIPKVDYDKVFK